MGYGTFEFTFKAGKYTARPHDQDESASQGFVAFWSLKSPEWPLVRTLGGLAAYCSWQASQYSGCVQLDAG